MKVSAHFLGFTLLEVILAVVIVALISATLGPVLINTVKAQRQAYTLLEPLAEVNNCFALFSDDMLTAPRPNGTHAFACSVEELFIEGQAASSLTISTAEYAPLHPNLISSAVNSGQVAVSWTVVVSPEQRGLAWLRSRQVNLLASGILPNASGEIIMDNLAYLHVEALVNDDFKSTFNSDEAGAVLPTAFRIRFAHLDKFGEAGPERIRLICLPQVLLDPIQMAGG